MRLSPKGHDTTSDVEKLYCFMHFIWVRRFVFLERVNLASSKECQEYRGGGNAWQASRRQNSCHFAIILTTQA